MAAPVQKIGMLQASARVRAEEGSDGGQGDSPTGARQTLKEGASCETKVCRDSLIYFIYYSTFPRKAQVEAQAGGSAAEACGVWLNHLWPFAGFIGLCTEGINLWGLCLSPPTPRPCPSTIPAQSCTEATQIL